MAPLHPLPRRARLHEEIMGDSVTRFRGCKTVRRYNIRKLGNEVGDALQSGEKVGFEWS